MNEVYFLKLELNNTEKPQKLANIKEYWAKVTQLSVEP